MFRNMVTSLFKHDKIRTTDAKAKELRRWADHLITLAKRGDLHARRQALSIVREKAVVHKLFAEAEERFGNVSGGYTRIIKIGRRPGDAAPVSFIELISKEDSKPAKEKKKKEVVPEATPDTDVKASATEEAAADDTVQAEAADTPQEEATVDAEASETAPAEKDADDSESEEAEASAEEAASDTEAASPDTDKGSDETPDQTDPEKKE